VRYLVCYDITDDRRRQRISDLLLDYGVRVQESVFECLVEPELAGPMRQRLESAIDALSDSVLVFAVCDACASRIATMGIAQRVEDPESYII
jgi:CRISPR-associated protein Cas2